MLRRDLLRSSALLVPVTLLAACSTTSSNGQSTVTIDTAALDTRGGAIITALASILAAPSVAILLGPNMAVAEAALAAAKLALSQIDAMTNGKLTLSVDTSKVASLTTSIVTDAQTVLNLAQSQVSKLPTDVATKVGDYIAAVLTLLPLLQVAAGIAGQPKAAKPIMTEAEALRVATH